MNRFSICLGLFIAIMLLSMVLSPVWYLNPPLIGIFLYIWHAAKTRTELIPVLLICGEISCITAWYASPWFAWIIQFSVIGLFLFRLNFSDSRLERISFITLYGALALITFLTDQINHTVILVILMFFTSVVVILFVLVSEFRLRREYKGEIS